MLPSHCNIIPWSLWEYLIQFLIRISWRTQASSNSECSSPIYSDWFAHMCVCLCGGQLGISQTSSQHKEASPCIRLHPSSSCDLCRGPMPTRFLLLLVCWNHRLEWKSSLEYLHVYYRCLFYSRSLSDSRPLQYSWMCSWALARSICMHLDRIPESVLSWSILGLGRLPSTWSLYNPRGLR